MGKGDVSQAVVGKTTGGQSSIFLGEKRNQKPIQINNLSGSHVCVSKQCSFKRIDY